MWRKVFSQLYFDIPLVKSLFVCCLSVLSSYNAIAMDSVIDVQTGQVKIGQNNAILKSGPLGSCIAVVFFDATRKIGAMAHIMLPGKAPAKTKPRERTRYAVDAIDLLIDEMQRLGSTVMDIDVILIGGANVLQRPDDSICQTNINSVRRLIDEKELNVVAQALGGVDRMSASLDLAQGQIFYTEGNGTKKKLWQI